LSTELAIPRNLTSGRLLARNTIWNLAASVASILIALFSVPILLRYLGTDRFGVISLVWVIEGQFGIFDLGLGQALTKLIAERLGACKEHETPPIFWSSLLIMSSLGVLGAVILRFASGWLVHHILKVPVNIQSETVTALRLVAISLPVVISSSALRGYLIGYQRFDILSAIRVPVSLFSYLVPLIVLPFSKKLGPFIGVLVLSRFIAWIIHLVMCLRVSPVLREQLTIRGAPFAHMFRFGGWMTVTNTLGPIMVSLDRLLIGALISMTAVAYYATAYEAVTKLWIIPTAISGVLFPAFATALIQDRKKAAYLYKLGAKYILLSLFPIVLGVLTLGHFALQLWLGPGLAQKCTPIMHILVIGVFANSLAQVPFWQIQAAGRPDIAAKIHLVELPLYLLTFWTLTGRFGVQGASVAWMLRATLDAIVMYWFSGRLLVESRSSSRHLLEVCMLAAPFLVVAMLIKETVLAACFFCIVCGAFLLIAWLRYLTPAEKTLALNPIRLFRDFQFSTS
jgi:O-antigen/teichoic acid export membrane protein